MENLLEEMNKIRGKYFHIFPIVLNKLNCKNSLEKSFDLLKKEINKNKKDRFLLIRTFFYDLDILQKEALKNSKETLEFYHSIRDFELESRETIYFKKDVV